jgi:4a-hydroxytetrahydrobiopterin dehydratase
VSKITLQSLASQHCVNAGALKACGADEIDAHLAVLPEWRLENGEIAKTFKFADYYRTMAFVNALAWISHREDHHPDLSVHFNRCRVAYSTHALGGISRNDFVCAAKIEMLL